MAGSSMLRPRIYLLIGVSGLLLGCARGPRVRPPADAPAPNEVTRSQTAGQRGPLHENEVELYRRMGLLAEGGETPFVGNLSFFAGATSDSTVILLTVALANRALHFAREGDRYRAAYNVELQIRRGTDTLRDISARETVRILAYREAARTDESVLFRQVVTLAPGTYEMRLTLRDEAVAHGSAVEATVGVPRYAEGAVSSPVPFYEANPRSRRDTLPSLLPTPRATAVFGRDSVLSVYAEGYGTGSTFPLRVVVRSDDGSGVLWSDSVSLPKRSGLFGGTFDIPIAKIGVGVMSLGISRIGGADTVRTPLFVAFGDDLPVTTFAEMLVYLRYFASSARLQAMREATGERRAALWAAFIRETDPYPQTPQHEGLRDYFARIAQANARFREEGGDGWLTDRGRVFVALGPPDQVYEPNPGNLGQRGRSLVWEYREFRLQVIFYDQTGFGRWRMTLPSESEFESAARRVLVN